MHAMSQWNVFGAVAVLAVLFSGPASVAAAGRALSADTPFPIAAGVEPAASYASVLPEVQAAASEVQPAPRLQVAAPALTNILSRVSSHKAPTKAPPPTTINFKNRLLTKLPSGGSMLTAGDLASQYTGGTRPQVFRGRSPGFKPQANGISGMSYSDSRFTADYVTLGQTRVGRLFMMFDGRWYSCTASVINKALLITAAHCVCDFGKGQNCFPDMDENGNIQVLFHLGRDAPANDLSELWSAAGILVAATYAAGTENNIEGGIVTNNDLALIWLNPKDGQEVGDVGGWFSYAVNGWGFAAPSAGMGFGAPTAPVTSQVTVLGYPAAFDRGNRMQISNSAAYNAQFGGLKAPRVPRAIKNLIRGTAFTPGSSGSAWVANYGIDADIGTDAEGVPLGQYGYYNAERNVVLGVTSWGDTVRTGPEAPAYSGCSMFATNREFPASTYGIRGPGNIGALMDAACENPGLPDWQLASKGLCE